MIGVEGGSLDDLPDDVLRQVGRFLQFLPKRFKTGGFRSDYALLNKAIEILAARGVVRVLGTHADGTIAVERVG